MIVRHAAWFTRVALLLGFSVCVAGAAVAEVPVPQTYGDAMRWYQRAAQEGNAEAQYLLALKYERGVDVPADAARAAFWYGKAAEQGHLEAQFKLASMYARGIGIERDPAAAAEWYRRAAEQGLAAAQFNLGVALLNGSGVARDPEQALAWISIAADAGLSQASELRDKLRRSLPSDVVEAAGARATELKRSHAL